MPPSLVQRAERPQLQNVMDNFPKSRPSPPVGPRIMFCLPALGMRFLLLRTNLQLMTVSNIMQAKLMEQQVTLCLDVVCPFFCHLVG